MPRDALFAIASVLGLGLLSSSCSRNAPVEAGGTSDPTLPAVAVARVTTRNLSRDVVLTAEFKPFQEIDVMAKVAGYVKQINVDIGDRVNQGQLLATLEIPEMEDDRKRALAAVQQSEAEMRRAQDELQRAMSAEEMTHLSYTRLDGVNKQRPGLVAQQEIDDAHSKDLVAEAQVAAARSALDAAKQQVSVHQADVSKTNTLFEYTKVTAPFTGVITKRYADTGSMIQAGTASQTQAMPVVRLSQNGLLRLILPVPESTVPTIHLGQQVEVHVPTLNRSFPGKVARFANQLSLQTRTMDTEVDVPNPSLVLVPGMYAEVNLALSERNRVLAIPVTAVDVDSEASAQSGGARISSGRVMVVTPNNRVEVRNVSLGLETASEIEVRSGLNEGDLVVIGGRSGLQSGEEVKPKITTLAASKS
jgi:RND family efflux transporter MFP subunit